MLKKIVAWASWEFLVSTNATIVMSVEEQQLPKYKIVEINDILIFDSVKIIYGFMRKQIV